MGNANPKNMTTIKQGDRVEIRPEWQDEGDSELQWVACDDEEKGRVTIMPTNSGLTYPPRATVEVSMLIHTANKLITQSREI
jgi:hypothetical protein